jgi:hypothetical protein
VHVIIRRATLDVSMSRYLVDRIESNPGIVVWPSTQVTALTGTNRLEAVRLRREGQPEASEPAVSGLFVFIGANPGTGWLAGQLAEDRHGFLLTGSDIPPARLEDQNLTPLFLETSRPGIFAVGDVRSGSVKRVAAAIGVRARWPSASPSNASRRQARPTHRPGRPGLAGQVDAPPGSYAAAIVIRDGNEAAGAGRRKGAAPGVSAPRMEVPAVVRWGGSTAAIRARSGAGIGTECKPSGTRNSVPPSSHIRAAAASTAS